MQCNDFFAIKINVSIQFLCWKKLIPICVVTKNVASLQNIKGNKESKATNIYEIGNI